VKKLFRMLLKLVDKDPLEGRSSGLAFTKM
jgi:hypothetical protein